MKSSWTMAIVAVVWVVACAPAEEGEDVLGDHRNPTGGARSNGGASGSKPNSSSGGERSTASGGTVAAYGSGGASAPASSGGVAGALGAPSASGGFGSGGAVVIASGGAGNGPSLVFGSGGVAFATGGARNTAGSAQAGFTSPDPNSDTHVDLPGDGWIDIDPSSGDLGGGGVRTSIDWGP